MRKRRKSQRLADDACHVNGPSSINLQSKGKHAWLEEGRGTAGKAGNNGSGLNVMDPGEGREDALQFGSVNNVDDRDLLSRHVGGNANTALTDRLFDVIMGW